MPTNHDFLNLLLTQVGAPYRFGAEDNPADPNAPKDHGTDCSEFGQWGCDRLGVIPAYPDGTWNQVTHCREHKTLMDIEDAIATAGAALFYFSSDPYKGKRPAEAHTAYSLGDGRSVEARSTHYGTGIFTATGRPWTHAARIPGLTYLPASTVGIAVPTPNLNGPPAFPGRVFRLTAPPEHGPDIRTWQAQMVHRGWALTVDGVYGPKSKNACERFQHEKGLHVDGLVGPATWKATWAAPIT